MGALALALITAVLFAVSVINDWDATDGLVITMVLLLIVGWIWSRLSLQRIALRRELSTDRARVGDTIHETMTLLNRSIVPKLWIEVRDYSSLPGHGISRALHVGGRDSQTWSVATRCQRRGRFRLGPLVVASGDPLGLYQLQRSIPGTHELLVLPAAVDVSGIDFPAEQLSGGASIMRIASSVSPSIGGLREYAPGDPLGHISWKATARRGTMMVKEFEPDPTADIVLIVDLNDSSLRPIQGGISGYPDVPLDTTEEFVISIAASLADRALGEGRKVGMIVNRAMPIRMMPDSSQRQWLRVFETLAVATSFGHRPLDEAIGAEASKLSRMTGLIVVTATRDDTWLGAVQALTDRRIPVTVVLIDDAWTNPDADSLARVEQAVVAARARPLRFPTHATATPSGVIGRTYQS